jgi:glycosyltransferase involved in cell wall biosynthesis
MAPPKRSRPAVRAEFRLASDTPLILSVGRLHPQKRYDLLIDAASRWRDLTPPPVVVVAGSGPSYMDLAQRASEKRARLYLLGHRDDVPDLLSGADLAVVTSDWEARQLFAQEALRAGVPLVTTAVGGLPGLVGDAAVQIPPGDVDALDRAVRDLLADPAVRADYAARGTEQAAGWPGEQDTIDDVLAAYAEVTAARR